MIEKQADSVLGQDSDVVVEHDVLCFRTGVPQTDQLSAETRQHMEYRRGEEVDLHRTQYVEKDDIEIFGVPLVDSKDRINSVKDGGPQIRTGKVQIAQSIDGTIDHHVREAESECRRLLEVSSLINHTNPKIIRSQLHTTQDGDENLLQQGTHYEILRSESDHSLGGRFKKFPDELVWGTGYERYLGEAYESYTQRVRDELRLQQVIGCYVDSRVSQRPVDGQLLSACSAIELLATRYHDYSSGISGETAAKIEHLIGELDVETDDLRESTETDTSNLDVPEYSWAKERNFVVHGTGQPSYDELISTHIAVEILLQRIIRNQLIGANGGGNYRRLYDLSPPSELTF